MKPSQGDFIGATILVVILFTLVAIIVGGNIPAA
jgi:hypothetical protein